MINLVIVSRKSVIRLQNKTTNILRACEIRSLCVFFALPRSLKLSLLYSIVFHTVLRIPLVLPVFLVHRTAKIWRNFNTSSSLLIFRGLWLPFTELYIFDKLRNVQSIVNMRNWTGDHVTMATQASLIKKERSEIRASNEKKGCESGLPYCFLNDFTKFFL